MDIHQGRLIDHIGLVVNDFEACRTFYRSILTTLDIPIGGEDETHLWADELYIGSKNSGMVQGTLTGRHHLAFQARDEESVRRFYEAALNAGGRDNGPPGPRNYHPGYFAAFVLDPDGNNIEAVYHGPVKRTADSVIVSFQS